MLDHALGTIKSSLAFDHVALVEKFETNLNSTHVLSGLSRFPALNLTEIVCISYTDRSSQFSCFISKPLIYL